MKFFDNNNIFGLKKKQSILKVLIVDIAIVYYNLLLH
jgi:hypothetical protein